MAQIIVLAALAATFCASLISPVGPFDHVPGRVLVLCFLAAVSLFYYRDTIPCSLHLAMGSAVASAILLEIPNASYLAAFPVAYLTVWLGLRNPPRIPFGDLSYGVYLLHFPIEQTIMHLFPGAGSWWRLTLMTAAADLYLRLALLEFGRAANPESQDEHSGGARSRAGGGESDDQAVFSDRRRPIGRANRRRSRLANEPRRWAGRTGCCHLAAGIAGSRDLGSIRLPC